MAVILVGRSLRRLGWKFSTKAGRRVAVANFQRAYNLGPALLVDGKAGPKTRDALARSIKRLNAGRPTASRSFSFTEFRCQCGGTLPGCEVIRVLRQEIRALEVYREAFGPVRINSGYRCPRHNARIGGARNSQHLYGAAVDVDPTRTLEQVKRLRVFSGIGVVKKTGKVLHVDVRHITGNSTPGTVDRPTVWFYS
jgi:hypothetical protein